MAKVKLNVARLTRLELCEVAGQSNEAMDGNARFPEPKPSVEDMASAIDASKAAEEELAAARRLVKEKLLAAKAASAVLGNLMRQRGSYVQTESAGDEAVILSSGLPVRSEAKRLVLTEVMGLEATFGENGGEADLSWDRVRRANVYELQCSRDPVSSETWEHAGISTKSSATLTRLTTGARYWFRVRAVGARGNGAWSDPATTIVP